MNEYVITFKYNDEGFMRHIIADDEDLAVGIAFARTRSMLSNFDPKNVTDLSAKELGKKERIPPAFPTSRPERNMADWGTAPGATIGTRLGSTSTPDPVAPIQHITLRDAANMYTNMGRLMPAFHTGEQFNLNGQMYMIVPSVEPAATTSYVEDETTYFTEEPSQLTGQLRSIQAQDYQRQLNVAMLQNESARTYGTLNRYVNSQPSWQPVQWAGQNDPQTFNPST